MRTEQPGGKRATPAVVLRRKSTFWASRTVALAFTGGAMTIWILKIGGFAEDRRVADCAGIAAMLSMGACVMWRISMSRLVLGKQELTICNPLTRTVIGYRAIREINESGGGSLEISTVHGKIYSPSAFSGSLLDEFFHTTENARRTANSFLPRTHGTSQDAPRAITTFPWSWFADTMAIAAFASLIIAVAFANR